MSDASRIVSAYQAALGQGDFDAARKFMNDDMSFHGPLETLAKPEPYLESLKKLHPVVRRIDMKKIFSDGPDVCVLYDMVTNTPAGTAFIAEWYQVRGGKIAAIQAVFDGRPFAAMFDQPGTA